MTLGFPRGAHSPDIQGIVSWKNHSSRIELYLSFAVVRTLCVRDLLYVIHGLERMAKERKHFCKDFVFCLIAVMVLSFYSL